MLLYDGVCSQVMGVLTGGAFLVAFALMLGASNKVIGLIAALGPITQLLQIPTIYLVDYVRLRKALVVISSFFSRTFWFVVATLPWLVPTEYRVTALILCIFFYFVFGTVSGCAFNSWIRDLIPQETMGAYFGKRMAVSTATGALLTLIAGFTIEWLKNTYSGQIAYGVFFLVGAASGMFGVYFLSRIPEPQMEATIMKNPVKAIVDPLMQINFRRLLIFTGSWSFAVNMAAPFFVVYMLKRIDMRMDLILALSVLSQLFNVGFVRIWGKLADRFSNKSVLSVSGSLFILSIFLWPFLTLPEKHYLTLPLLIVIHVLTGTSTAGVALASNNLALKLAPYGSATSFLAINAMTSGIGATVAPLIAGVGADWFDIQQLSISLRWINTAETSIFFDLRAFDLKGLDFLFVLAVIFGLYAMHRLLAVKEEGEVEEDIVIEQLWAESRKAVRHVSNIAGIRTLFYFPFARLVEKKNTQSANT
ncbi:MAG: MFS transporter [Thermodesulfobacteriota bacterium]|nr:MFS transporter [Thermodesulfobacteriota bacterium]